MLTDWQPTRTGKEHDMQERFWEQVDVRGPDQCWHWLGHKTPRGYGRPMFNGRRRMAHRWALEFATGDDGEGRVALHACDNPRCVNPAHLRWGTQLENIQDRVVRGRNGAARGTANGSAKLTPNCVRAIRADPRPSRLIAKDYDVSQVLISKIKRGELWRDVNGMDAAEAGEALVSTVQSHTQEQER